jgi:hypothetical protein
MKARYVVLLIMLAACTSQTALAQSTATGVNLPLKAGQFSTTTTGSIAICLNPTTFVEEACTTKGVIAAPLTVVSVGNGTGTAQGTGCESIVETDSDFPVDASPPLVTPNEHIVFKITDYDLTTGAGDDSFTGNVGGHCNGANFVSTGATQVSSGTGHFNVSENGNRVDGLATKLINPTNSVGDFSLYTVNHLLVTTNP